MNQTTNKEDYSIGSIVHQGKSIAEWTKVLEDEFGFTEEQVFKLARSGVDLDRMRLGLDEAEEKEDSTVDEAQSIDDKALFKDEEFFFEDEDDGNVDETTDEEAALDESVREPEDVVTVADFIEILRRRTSLDDKVLFRSRNRLLELFDVESKAGTAVVDFIVGKNNQLSEKDQENMKSTNEGRYYSRTGGYGGYGRSYSSYGGSSAPRGASIGWYSVEDLDPKAKGKMVGWRCGPTNFPFEDLLYPERKYKIGTMAMRNKYIKAGEMSGEKYIAIPSYFDAIKSNDEAAISLLSSLKIPLDLTFGMDPDDDYSVCYTTR